MALALAPAEWIDGDDRDRKPADGIALCLSGGGYRAMLFHAGALWRLHELRYLPLLKRVSSVSGGSIAAAVLGLAWPALAQSPEAGDFERLVVTPLRRLARRTIDVRSIRDGLSTPGPTADALADEYREHLFGSRTLQDLPRDDAGPRFVINATSVQTGTLWRFSKPYAANDLVGRVEKPTIDLAVVVAASSALPPVLSPVRIALSPGACEPVAGSKHHAPPYTTDLVLTDGGVYDNLGLETTWKRFGSLLVSDAGARLRPEADPASSCALHALRVVDLIDNQVRSLQKRQLIASCELPETAVDHRAGAYWGLGTSIEKYGVPDALPCPAEHTATLANFPTRLEAMDERQQERLVNWGYAVCDAAMRKHVFLSATRPRDFPYPDARVA